MESTIDPEIAHWDYEPVRFLLFSSSSSSSKIKIEDEGRGLPAKYMGRKQA